MREELKRQILIALDRAAQDAGSSDLQSGLKNARKMLLTIAMMTRQMSPERLERWLDRYEPSGPQEEALLLAYAELISQLTRALASRGSEELLKAMPPAPGGRPRVLTETKLKIVNDILDFQRQRVRIGVAKERVATRYRLSEHTVDSVWRARDQLKSEAPPFVDLLKMLLAELGAQDR